MTTPDAATQVQAAADALVDAFGRSDRDAYFSCFAPEATFLFHTTPGLLRSRAEYERLWAQWVTDDAFRVVACASTEPDVHVVGASGEAAVFSHRVRTVVETRAGRQTSLERETIVFVLTGAGWAAVHEHLSPDPGSSAR